VQSEILFNLPISKYPQLIAMEERNGIYQKIYDIFANHAEKVKEFSMRPWPKLDVAELREEADLEQRLVRNLAKLLTPAAAEKHSPFVKLKAKILAFQNSLPLIEQLRNDAVKERHWNRIIQETGKEDSVGEIVLKNINLQKVFDMQLDESPEVV
jgi:dynein heavy chain, axonemal